VRGGQGRGRGRRMGKAGEGEGKEGKRREGINLPHGHFKTLAALTK